MKAPPIEMRSDEDFERELAERFGATRAEGPWAADASHYTSAMTLSTGLWLSRANQTMAEFEERFARWSARVSDALRDDRWRLPPETGYVHPVGKR